ncbi:hypothetical protein [Pseudohaliea rubra]|uniref:hypothetical protein n=1 Tax=Pseudohaliea rubra TaxID=475795 RepID=UPI0005530A2B|nr:hypothetical protein [Pseudohaliea rubra]
MSQEDEQFLADALEKIADGESAEEVLDVKARRGERKSAAIQKANKKSSLRRQHALAWMQAAKTPEDEGGLGMALEEAAHEVSKYFPFSAETLLQYFRVKHRVEAVNPYRLN